MIVVEYKDIDLDYCTECQGVWFDVGELELLFHKMNGHSDLSMASILQSPEARTSENSRKCPICGTRMKKANVGQDSKTIIDVCPRSHGIWFDGGELDALVNHLAQHTAGAGQPHTQVFSFLGEVFQHRGKPDK